LPQFDQSGAESIRVCCPIDSTLICPIVARSPIIIRKAMTAEQKSALAGVVTIDKEVMHGTPCFAHTRVPVQTLIDFLKTGETIDDFLAVYPPFSGNMFSHFSN
jgi:uncharacterized protein (DUF433 family)